jgi:hypothetical protein
MPLIRSAGAEQLLAAASIAEAARRTKLSQRSVIAHRTGAAAPNANAREAYSREFGIGVDGWDHLPKPKEPPAATESPQDGAPPPADSAVARVKQQIEDLLKLRAEAGLTPKARLETERLLQSAYRDLARLEGARLTERQILASPHWARLEDAVMAALRGHTLAGLALADAISAYAATDGATPSHKVAEVRARVPELVGNVERAQAALAHALSPKA